MKKFIQDHINSTYSKINQFHVEDAYSDIEVAVEDKTYKCHQLILAAASPYFHNLFSNIALGVSPPDIVIPDVEQQTFEEVLRFIYGGEIHITSSNVFNLVRASHILQIYAIEDACVDFLRGQMVGRPVESAMDLFLIARAHGRTNLADLLGEYIHKNFDYYSKLPNMFVTMKADDFLAILDLIPKSSSSMPHDVFMFAILKWTRDAQISARDRKFWFDRFVRRIDFAKLSAACIEFITRLSFEDLIVLRELTELKDDPPPPSTCVPSEFDDDAKTDRGRESTRMHVYVNAYAEDEQEFDTRVFTLYPQFSEENWVQSCHLDCTESPIFMRTLILNESIYSLSYSKNPKSSAPEKDDGVQVFRISTSVSLFTDTFLSLPPLTLDKYDMCGHDESIFVYGKNTLSAKTTGDEKSATFDKEQLHGGVYRFNRLIDSWFPLPAPKHKYANACMTCDGPVVYLIGGTNSNKVAQCYDIRTPAWTAITHTSGIFENAACCVLDGKVFVCGGTRHQKGVEMYDPKAAKWEKMAPMKQARSDHQLMPFSRAPPRLVTGGRVLSTDCDLEILNVAENKWQHAVPLYKPAINSTTNSRKSLKVIDMIMYKSYGL